MDQFRIIFPPIPQKYKAMYKNELAEKAGVSLRVFRRWLMQEKDVLSEYCDVVNDKILPPVVVKYLCDKYVIFLEDE